jgi:hypothetical protein
VTAPSESQTSPETPAPDAAAWASINTIKVLAMDAVEKSQSGYRSQPQKGRPPRRERLVTTVPSPHLGQVPNCSEGAVASFLM